MFDQFFFIKLFKGLKDTWEILLDIFPVHRCVLDFFHQSKQLFLANVPPVGNFPCSKFDLAPAFDLLDASLLACIDDGNGFS